MSEDQRNRAMQLLTKCGLTRRRYLPALFDPSTNSLLVQPSAPAYILAQRVKRLKTSNNTTNLSNPSEMRALQRDQLGEAFGTRKAKNRIKAAERNKVDASAQEGVKGHLLESIQTASASMPTEGEPVTVFPST